MAGSLNKVMLIGNLTRDPETRTTPTGQTVSSFGLATNRTWKDQAGQKQEKVEFHNIVAWGKLGELAGQYLSKGRKAWVEGHLQTRDWTGEDGVKRYKTEIVADNVIFLDRAEPGGAFGGAARPAMSPPRPTSLDDHDQTSNEPLTPPEEDIKIENIPF